MKRLWFALLLALPLCVLAQQQKLPLPLLPDSLKQPLTSYLHTHPQAPEDYVLAKFKDHDIIFIGEQHRIKENVELIQRLIPLCNKSGIYTLGFEFARRTDQPLIDSLLSMPAYSDALANQILFNGFVFWGYQEYADVFRAAWRVNHALANGARHFRILALGNSPDWSVVKSDSDRDDPKVMTKVWHGETETDWANVLLKEVADKHEKALVYSGIHHAFTAYKQPRYNPATHDFAGWGDTRCGNYVYDKIGSRAMTIYLHAPWNSSEGYDGPMVYAADGVIDALMAQLGPRAYPVGFDVKGTPFGKLSGQTSIYKYGYDHFTLENYCDGYIFQMPLSYYTGVTPIKDFVNESNLPLARLQSPNPEFRTATIEMFNDGIAEDANMARRLSQFR